MEAAILDCAIPLTSRTEELPVLKGFLELTGLLQLTDRVVSAPPVVPSGSGGHLGFRHFRFRW